MSSQRLRPAALTLITHSAAEVYTCLRRGYLKLNLPHRNPQTDAVETANRCSTARLAAVNAALFPHTVDTGWIGINLASNM